MKYLYSTFDSDTDALSAISEIYLNGEWYQCDPTYSKGLIHGQNKPEFASDISPIAGVNKADCRSLKYLDSSIKSVLFDPPFLFRNDITKKDGKTKALNTDKMCKRFSYFQDFNELILMYRDSLKEFKRILIDKGYLIFKCQDFTDGSGTRPFYDTHSFIIDMARARGFSLRDIAIVVNKSRLMSKGKQGCLRKAHCYLLVFKKETKELGYMINLKRHKKQIVSRF